MNLVKQNNTPQKSENLPKEVGFFRKELNIYGKGALIAGYTFICLFAGATLFHSKSEIQGDLDHLRSINQEILKSLGTQKGSDTISLIQSNHNLTDRIEKKMIDSLEKRETLQTQKINELEEEIEFLKKKLQAKITTERIERASKKQEVVALSKANMRVLRYEQSLRRDEFKEKQKSDREAYMASLDMKSSIGQAKYRKFLHNQKMELYKIEQEFVQERNDFRNKKFRVVKNELQSD